MTEAIDSSSNVDGKSEEDFKVVLREKARGSKRISWLLDECIRVPGTNIRFGLDPILGLLPFGGETVATIMGAFLLGDAGRKGLPFKTLIRMSGNMVLNAGVGWIPGLGDLFSFWFKSNSRNYEMLSEFMDSEDGQQAKGGWWPFFVIFGVIGLVLVINVLGWIILFKLVSGITLPSLPTV